MDLRIADLAPLALAVIASIPAVLAYRRGQKADDRAEERGRREEDRDYVRELRERLEAAERTIAELRSARLNGQA